MIALIPARGGSKGLPGKNIKILKDKPLIAYAIESALKAKSIKRVIVSTDDLEIAKVAKSYGAEVPFLRPKRLATDDASAIDVYLHFISYMDEQEQDISDFIVLQPTSPFRTAKHIEEAIDLYKEKNADSVISYCPENHPVKWHKYVSEEGRFEEIFDKVKIANRQEERISYYPNGAIFIFKRHLIENKKYYSDSSFAYIMNRNDSVDIDTQEDFDYAEYLFERKNY